MRHRLSLKKLQVTSSHRLAMLRNMSIALIMHGRIKTTLTKAKALRRFVEPLVTKSKNDTLHSRRVLFSRIRNRDAVQKLFNDIGRRFSTRPGGYTRIVRYGFRPTDNATRAFIEFVDYDISPQPDTIDKE